MSRQLMTVTLTQQTPPQVTGPSSRLVSSGIGLDFLLNFIYYINIFPEEKSVAELRKQRLCRHIFDPL